MGAADRRQQEENGGGKKKSELQLQSLERFYSDGKYPGRTAMEEYGTYLGLTYNQVRVWFSERRRKEKRAAAGCGPRRRSGGRGGRVELSSRSEADGEPEPSGSGRVDGVESDRDGSLLGRSLARVQVLMSREHILTRVFRKDGPPLGIEFDSVPARGFDCYARCGKGSSLRKEIKGVTKKRKDPEFSSVDSHHELDNGISTRKFGIGKGLMTVWRATNPGRGFPVGLSSFDRGMAKKLTSNCNTTKTVSRRENMRHMKNQAAKTFRDKINDRRKHQLKMAKVLLTKNIGQNVKQQFPSEGCGLLCSELRYQGRPSSTLLMDDEELELSEMQSGSNSFRCSAHLVSNGRNGCPLCKDMLDRFPPESVTMKMPICLKPWSSSPNLVKKLFKVVQFLYTCADKVDAGSFTLDELAEAFLEKDSILLGKIHVSLLKVLLFNVHLGISSTVSRPSKDCRFLGFMHSVKKQDLDVAFWIKSLNALTWSEILRQVSIAAGFGSVGHCIRRECSDKEDSDMARYGLRPHTLKHELFVILAEKGSRGLKVLELAKAVKIAALGLPSSIDELECLISSTLSSDITLFEKIGTSAFRLRSGLSCKTDQNSDCESDDFGSIDNDHLSCSSNSNFDDCEFDLLEPNSVSHVQPTLKRKSKRTHQCMEIDESFSGEAWLMGLMEGEYSDLSVEEKLDALVALVDLTNSALCLGIDSIAVPSDIHNHNYKSGGKIKKKSQYQACPNDFPSKLRGFQEGFKLLGCDAATQNCRQEEAKPQQHALQAINLGYDRRYNRYWLFLGPCEKRDPGHRRVYFESSEDGHWEVIDSKQALSSLMSALDCRGTRESHLFASMEKREGFLSKAMAEYMETEIVASQRRLIDSPDSDAFSGIASSLISDVDNNVVSGDNTNGCSVSPSVLVGATVSKYGERKVRKDQLEAFDKWIWTSFLDSFNAVKNQKSSYWDCLVHCERCHDLFWRDEKHCKICHMTFELDLELEEKYTIHVATCSNSDVTLLSCRHKVLPPQLQAMKAALYAIKGAMPEQALLGWTKSFHNLWGKRLRRTTCLSEFLLVVNDFIGAIKEEWLDECALQLGSGFQNDVIVLFQSIPHTVAAIALWMVKLDFLIAPYIERIAYPGVARPALKRMRSRPCRLDL